MKSTTALWALIVINAVLLLSFVNRLVPDHAAMAQRAAAPAGRMGDYIMIPANVTGVSSGIVVVVDQTNAQLSAFSYDDANHRIDTMQKIDLQQVFQRQPGLAPRSGRGY